MTSKIEEMQDTLENFRIGAVCKAYKSHRHFCHYDLELHQGQKINKLTSFATEIGLALCSNPPMIQQIPSEGIVRLHFSSGVPEIIDFDTIYNNSTPPENYFLPFLLGETDLGEPLWVDMSKNPHMLIAGASGSGKSIFLHILIQNALKLGNIDLYLVDTKKVEFGKYQTCSKIKSIDKDYESAMRTVDKLISIMEQRFEILETLGVSNIESVPFLDPILFIADEFADLVLSNKDKELEIKLAKLASKSRAAGIHLNLATQRPSTDVVTGLIKANFAARVSFKTSSQVESKIILDTVGSEKLTGKGDGLLKTSGHDNIRFQSAYFQEAA